jgi:hypothetical protein
MWEEASQKPRELVREYPLSSTLLVFGVGIGVGMLLGQTVGELLFESHQPPSRLGRVSTLANQLCDSVRHSVSEAMEKHLRH